MITEKAIAELYRRYRRRAGAGAGALDLAPLRDPTLAHHSLALDPTTLTIGSLDADAPLRRLPLANICGVASFDECVAIVLPASILFLDRRSPAVSVHLRADRPNPLRRLLRALRLVQ